VTIARQAATPQAQVLDQEKPRDVASLTPEDVARIEKEMDTVGRNYKNIEESFGRNSLNLVLAVGYLKRLLDNARIVKFLSQRYPDILGTFQQIIDAAPLEKGAGHPAT
jgi:hypothetical protein